MNTPPPLTFSCSNCGARFALDPTAAGRKIACQCDNIFIAPPMPEGWEGSAYELADHSPAATPAVKKKKESVFAAYPQRKAAQPVLQEEPDRETFSAMRDRVVPIGLLIVGLGLRIAEIPMDRALNGSSMGVAVAVAMFQMILTASVMLAGMYASAKILGTNFGALTTAILKLCAIAIFAWACGAFCVAASHTSGGGVLAIRFILLIDFIGLWLLFKLDLQEALFTAAICGFLQAATALVVFTN